MFKSHGDFSLERIRWIFLPLLWRRWCFAELWCLFSCQVWSQRKQMDSSGFHEHQAPGSCCGCPRGLPLCSGRLWWNFSSQYWYVFCCPSLQSELVMVLFVVLKSPGSSWILWWLFECFLLQVWFCSIVIHSMSLWTPITWLCVVVFCFLMLHLAVFPEYNTSFVCITAASTSFFSPCNSPSPAGKVPKVKLLQDANADRFLALSTRSWVKMLYMIDCVGLETGERIAAFLGKGNIKVTEQTGTLYFCCVETVVPLQIEQ